MRTICFLAALLAFTPIQAQSTKFKGIDLSEEGSDQNAQPEKKVTKPVEPEVPKNKPQNLSTKSESSLELEIVNEDRVKSVQRKAFLKKGRFELTPFGFATINDAFFPKYGLGARASFFFHDSLGLALRFQQFNHMPSNNVRLAKRQLNSKLPSVLPKYSYALDVLWSPIYGKVALFNSIHTFDLYIVGGVGAVWSQTSSDDGLHPSGHIGIGERFAIFDFIAADLAVVETLYTDRPDGANRSTIQNMISVNLGISFFVPLTFEYQEP